jgi:hypothetical protein
MKSQAGNNLGVGGVLMLIAMSIVALFVAFIAVPMIAQAAGLHEQHVNYAVAGAAFVIAMVAMRWAKSLNRKSSESK